MYSIGSGEVLTRAHCDGLHKLLSPAVGPDHQGQVGLLQEFIHGALKDHSESPRSKKDRLERPGNKSHCVLHIN